MVINYQDILLERKTRENMWFDSGKLQELFSKRCGGGVGESYLKSYFLFLGK